MRLNEPQTHYHLLRLFAFARITSFAYRVVHLLTICPVETCSGPPNNLSADLTVFYGERPLGGPGRYCPAVRSTFLLASYNYINIYWYIILHISLGYIPVLLPSMCNCAILTFSLNKKSIGLEDSKFFIFRAISGLITSLCIHQSS